MPVPRAIFGYDFIWLIGPGTELDRFVVVDRWVSHRSDIHDQETDLDRV